MIREIRDRRSRLSRHDARHTTDDPQRMPMEDELDLRARYNSIARSLCTNGIQEQMALMASSRDAIERSRDRLANSVVFHI
jgi:hypothetical protein